MLQVTDFGPMLDLRPLFPIEREALVELLGSLAPEDWAKPTVCPGWNVRDVVAHVLNDYLRRISGSRDGHRGAVFANDETLPAYLARTNDEFVRAARQCSPQVMVDLLTHLGPQLDKLWAVADLDAPADLDVSWADPSATSQAWLDIARDYTEFWVHQQQIRDAVGRPGADGPDLLGPVLDTFLRALPYALRAERRPDDVSLRFDITGPAGGTWWAIRAGDRWRLTAGGAVAEPTGQVVMDQDTLWRLATRGISVEEARGHSEMYGDQGLTRAATTLLAIVR
jgi:uncharacterized protein (TIGR03083 family)